MLTKVGLCLTEQGAAVLHTSFVNVIANLTYRYNKAGEMLSQFYATETVDCGFEKGTSKVFWQFKHHCYVMNNWCGKYYS